MNARALLRANIDRLLEERGKTRGQMAADMDRASSWISQILTGSRGRFLEHIDALAEQLGVHPATLFGCPPHAVPVDTPKLGKTPIASSAATDTEEAHSAHATDLESAGGSGVQDTHWKYLENTYEFYADDLDENGRRELVRAMRAAAKQFAEQRQKEAAKKASGE